MPDVYSDVRAAALTWVNARALSHTLPRDTSPVDASHYIATHGHFQRLTFTAERFVLYSARESTGGGPYLVEAAYPLG